MTSMTAGGRGPRVLGYVLSAYPVISQTFVRNEVVALRADAAEVHVATMGGGDGDVVDPSWAGPWTVMPEVPLRRALLDGLWWLGRPRALLRLVRALRTCGFAHPWLVARGVPTTARQFHRAGVQLCHSHFGWKGNAPALYIAALLGVPTTVTVHATDIFMPHANLGARLRSMAAVVTVCASNIPYITALGVPRERVSIVPCGVETDVPVPAPPVDPQRVVSVGRLVPKKGFDLLLDAFAAVVVAAPGATLRIIGDGPLRDDLERRAAELGLAHHVTFLGALAHDQVLEEVAGAAVYALTCRVLPNGESDAMPVAIREAMVRARPVVSTAVAGIPESVDDQVGWLVPPEDVEALTAALVQAVTDPATARQRGCEGRRRAQERWGLDACREQLQHVWAQLPAMGSTR